MLDDAHAFWLRAPGHGEIRPVALPEPGRGDVVVRTLRSGVSRGTETLVFRGGVPPGQYAAMRAPFQEGDFPGPVKYGYLNVGAVEQGPPELRGPHGLLPVPAPDGLRGAGRRRDRRARRRAARARRARRHRRDRCQRPVGRAAAGRRSRRRGRRRDGRLLRRPPARPVPGGRGHARRRRRVTGRGRGRARRRLRAAGRRRGRVRPGRAHERDVGRTAVLARPARARGHGARAQLVRRRRGAALAGRRVPLAPARAPRQPGGDGVPGPEHAPHDGRPAGPRARPAARPGLRCARHRRVALRRAARRHGAPGRGEPARALPHRSPTTGSSACSA